LALRFYEAAASTFALTATQPRIGAVRKYRDRLLAGIRIHPMKGFEKQLVFYRPLADGIEVLRVVHGARDLEALFSPEQ
jgi:toxin ParE1/3/4